MPMPTSAQASAAAAEVLPIMAAGPFVCRRRSSASSSASAGYHVGVIQPNLSGNAVCIGAAVACQQDHIQPKGFQRVKGGFAGGLYGIGNTGSNQGCVAVERKVKRGNAVSGQLLASLLQIGGQLALGGNKLCAAACHHLAGYFAGQALAVQNGNVLNGAQLDVLRSGFAHHGAGQRVLALAFQPGSHAKQELGGHVCGCPQW